MKIFFGKKKFFYQKNSLEEKGQSLLELVIAITLFAFLLSLSAFLIIGHYLPHRLAEEIMIADFLAREGIEATISIRDNNWDDLTPGTHGLGISENHWIFQGSEENVGEVLNNGVRKIIIEDAGNDRKKITSQVTWQFTKDRTEKVELITLLTNWQKITIYCQGTCTPCSAFTRPLPCLRQDGCWWNFWRRRCVGTCTPCEEFSDETSCENQSGCTWVGP